MEVSERPFFLSTFTTRGSASALRSDVTLRSQPQRRRVARQPAVILFLALLLLMSARYDHVVRWRRTGGCRRAGLRGQENPRYLRALFVDSEDLGLRLPVLLALAGAAVAAVADEAHDQNQSAQHRQERHDDVHAAVRTPAATWWRHCFADA